MTSMLAVKVTPTVWKHFRVPTEIAIYVKQLEYGIRRKESREALRKLYPKRFAEREEEDYTSGKGHWTEDY